MRMPLVLLASLVVTHVHAAPPHIDRLTANAPRTADSEGAREARPHSADGLESLLQQNQELEIETLPMEKFAAQLSKELKTPVYVQLHSEWSGIYENVSISLTTSGLPLEAELAKALRPHALRAIVQNDALVFIPDTVALARRGIGTARYITVDDGYMQQLEAKLAQPYAEMFNGIPLQDAMRIISEETEIQFVIDRRALEDLGMTLDFPVTIDMSGVSVYEFLQLMLRDADLVLHPRDGYVMVTTRDEADEDANHIARVYWLDGTGLDPDAAAEAIQLSVEPDTWPAGTGPPAMMRLTVCEQGRPGVIVSTRYSVHRQIEKLFDVIRQGVVDPRTAEVHCPPNYANPLGPMGMGQSAPDTATEARGK